MKTRHDDDCLSHADFGGGRRGKCTCGRDDALFVVNASLTTALAAMEQRFAAKCTATCMTQDDLLVMKQARAALALSK